MSYTLTFVRKLTHLHATVIGVNSKDAVKHYLEEIRLESLARGCGRLLIEERLEGPRLSGTDVFEIAARGSSGAAMFEAIAYVDVNADPGMMKFAETVAVNRGVPVRLFSTVADAEKWLLDLEGSGVV